jgi:nucleoside-diphosphate-sugar epimerase
VKGRLLVTGATGAVGRSLCAAARAAGWQVRGLARHRPADWADRSADSFVAGDIADRAAVERAAAGCQAIVHLASWVHRPATSAHDRQTLHAQIVDGTRHVAAAARAPNAQLVIASTVAVYGSPGPGLCDEHHPPAPETPYASAKLEAEAIARGLLPEAVVLRLALVYGPHDRGNFLRLVRAIDGRRAATVGEGNNRKSLVYVDNVADRVLRCLDRPAPLAGTWNVADGPAPTQRQLMEAIARALDRRPPLRVPEPAVRLVAGGLDLLTRRHFHLRDRVRKLSQPTEFAGGALDRQLDYQPRVSLDEGLRRTIEWYRRR